MGCTARIVLALIIVAFGAVQFLASTTVERNPYTGESQRIAFSPQQEVQLGLQSVPQMVRMHGGQDPDPQAQAVVDRVGALLAANVTKMARFGDPIGYPFDFHLLADEERINAFALPGGQIFITAALFDRLENEDQLAGVLGHEIGHVVAKHSNEQMSKSGLLRGIGQGIGVLAGGESMVTASQVANTVNHVLATRFGRQDEYEADQIGCELMHLAGFDEKQILAVLEILRQAAGSSRPPEILSTHPYPENRIENIRVFLEKFPG